MRRRASFCVFIEYVGLDRLVTVREYIQTEIFIELRSLHLKVVRNKACRDMRLELAHGGFFEHSSEYVLHYREEAFEHSFVVAVLTVPQVV